MPNENSSKNHNGLKAFILISLIFTIIAGMAAIVRPIQQQIDVIHNRMERIEIRIENQIEDLDTKIQIEVGINKDEIGMLRKQMLADDAREIKDTAELAILKEKTVSLEHVINRYIVLQLKPNTTN